MQGRMRSRLSRALFPATPQDQVIQDILDDTEPMFDIARKISLGSTVTSSSPRYQA